jgi:hypothetical protein
VTRAAARNVYQNRFEHHASPKFLARDATVSCDWGESFGRVMTANHCESPPLIRSFLIDFARPYAFRAVVCAKFFPRADVLVANNVNIEHHARSAKISWPKQVCIECLSLQKPLFHRAFLIFSDAHTP